MRASAHAPTSTIDTSPPAEAASEATTTMLEAPAGGDTPARLVMLSSPAPGAEFALSKDQMKFGRAEDLDAWVNHRSISREHAEVIRTNDGFRIVDLGSANGLRVNGEEAGEANLSAGDVVEMGQVRFRYVAQGEAFTFDADQWVLVVNDKDRETCNETRSGGGNGGGERVPQ